MSKNQRYRKYIVYICTAAVWLIPSFGGVGGGLSRAQSLSQHTIANIAKSDPLIITGAIGTQNTYYHSSIGDGYRSPWSNTAFVNLNISLYGISMPFAFYYSNNNTSFNFPHLSFHIDPTYKNWRGHFGRSNMAFSPYIMNMSFNGVGLEYTGKLRFGAFYGQLRDAINDDPTDPRARKPQYKRMGWGFKVGYGSNSNFIDLYLLRAYDKVNSISDEWQQKISPQENIAVAVKGGLTPFKWLSLRGNLAFSAFSSDRRAERVYSDKLDRWDKIFEARYTSLMRLATDVSANFMFKGFNASVYYKMVQPDYTTLGLYYTSNNYQSLGINASTTLFKKITLSANFSGQEDNITRSQLYTTRGFVYSASASTSIGDHLQLAAGYNGYRQVQSDGKGQVNDTTRVDRIMHSLYFTPSLSFDNERMGNTFSFSASYTQNKDLNRFATGESDVKSLALGLSHGLDVKAWEMMFTTSLSHQQSDGYKTRYTSDVLSLSTGRSFLKEKNLNTSASFNLVYNNIENLQKMLSFGADLSATYTLAKVHNFNFAVGFNKYSDTNPSADMASMGTTEFTASLGYTYTFTLLELKRKAEKSAPAGINDK